MKKHIFESIVGLSFAFLFISCGDGKKNEEPLTTENDTITKSIIDTTKVEKDEKVIKELSILFRKKTDEFKPESGTFYIPKSAPRYANENGVYLYFSLIDDKAVNLRLKYQYFSDDWLFIQSAIFLVDGKSFEVIPSSVETDSDTEIWEWFDEPIENTPGLASALENAKSVKVKLIGRQYHDIKIMTPKQLKAIKNTLKLYKAWGSTYY